MKILRNILAKYLDVTKVIKSPVVSDKAYKLNTKLKKATFEVAIDANKPMIAEAFFKLFNRKAKKINVQIRKGKRKKHKGRVIFDSARKIAVVTFVEGDAMDVLGQAGAGIVSTESSKKNKVGHAG